MRNQTTQGKVPQQNLRQSSIISRGTYRGFSYLEIHRNSHYEYDNEPMSTIYSDSDQFIAGQSDSSFEDSSNQYSENLESLSNPYVDHDDRYYKESLSTLGGLFKEVPKLKSQKTPL